MSSNPNSEPNSEPWYRSQLVLSAVLVMLVVLIAYTQTSWEGTARSVAQVVLSLSVITFITLAAVAARKRRK